MARLNTSAKVLAIFFAIEQIVFYNFAFPQGKLDSKNGFRVSSNAPMMPSRIDDEIDFPDEKESLSFEAPATGPSNDIVMIKTVRQPQIYLSDSSFVQTSITYSIWNTVTQTWISSNRNTFVFDSIGNMTEQSYQTWLDDAWATTNRLICTYDNHKRVEEVNQSWNGTGFENRYRYTTLYDANDEISVRSSQTWQESTWINSTQNIYGHDKNGNRTTSLRQSWSGNAWLPRSRSLYSFNEHNHRTEILYQNWNGTDFANRNLTKYSYDHYGNRTASSKYLWRDTAWIFPKTTMYENTYDDKGNRIEILSFTVHDTVSTKRGRTTMSYNGNGKMILRVTESWLDSTWKNSSQTMYTYDANGNEIGYLYQEWNGSSWQNLFRNISSWELFIPSIDVGSHIPEQYTLSENFPNPFNPETKISYSIPHPSSISLTIYDLLGRTIQVLVDGSIEAGTYSVTWDAQNMSGGIYFYRLVAGQFAETKKMVLMK